MTLVVSKYKFTQY